MTVTSHIHEQLSHYFITGRTVLEVHTWQGVSYIALLEEYNVVATKIHSTCTSSAPSLVATPSRVSQLSTKTQEGLRTRLACYWNEVQ